MGKRHREMYEKNRQTGSQNPRTLGAQEEKRFQTKEDYLKAAAAIIIVFLMVFSTFVVLFS